MKAKILEILNATHEDGMATETLDVIAAQIEAALREAKGDADCAAGNHAFEMSKDGKSMRCVRCGSTGDE